MLSPAADLLAQVAPEALDDGGGAGLLNLDQHLPLVAVGGAHAGREVHAQQGQRQAVLRVFGGAGHGGLLRADGDRLHLQAGDPGDQQAGDALVLHQVLEHHVIDGVGDVHAGIEPALRATGQSPAHTCHPCLARISATEPARTWYGMTVEDRERIVYSGRPAASAELVRRCPRQVRRWRSDAGSVVNDSTQLQSASSGSTTSIPICRNSCTR